MNGKKVVEIVVVMRIWECGGGGGDDVSLMVVEMLMVVMEC